MCMFMFVSACCVGALCVTEGGRQGACQQAVDSCLPSSGSDIEGEPELAATLGKALCFLHTAMSCSESKEVTKGVCVPGWAGT